MTTCKIISEFILSNTIFFLTDMTQQELLTIWAEEAKEALGAKKSGIILDLWKVVAERKVYVDENSYVFVWVFNMMESLRESSESHDNEKMCLKLYLKLKTHWNYSPDY